VTFVVSVSAARAECIYFGCGVVTFKTKTCRIEEISNQRVLDEYISEKKEKGYTIDTSDPGHLSGTDPTGNEVIFGGIALVAKRVIRIETQKPEVESTACAENQKQAQIGDQRFWFPRPTEDLSVLFYDSDDSSFCPRIEGKVVSMFLKEPRCCDVGASTDPLCLITPHSEVEELPEFLRTED
jgi:hypothetical protein